MKLTSKAEATVWFVTFNAMRRRGAGKDYASAQADESVEAWRERNPDRYAVIDCATVPEGVRAAARDGEE